MYACKWGISYITKTISLIGNMLMNYSASLGTVHQPISTISPTVNNVIHQISQLLGTPSRSISWDHTCHAAVISLNFCSHGKNRCLHPSQRMLSPPPLLSSFTMKLSKRAIRVPPFPPPATKRGTNGTHGFTRYQRSQWIGLLGKS